MKTILIVGATSGIGKAVALRFLSKGYRVVAVGRNLDALEALKEKDPQRVIVQQIDITTENAAADLQNLMTQCGDVDIYFHSSGVGSQNPNLDLKIETDTIAVNVFGMTQMVNAAYHYFQQKGSGQIAVISSIAGTKGLGVAPSYAATKAYQANYLQSLRQLMNIKGEKIVFTDIRPGFVATNLLKHHYPMVLQANKVAKCVVRAVEKKKRVAIIDWKYAFLVFFWRLIPNCIWEQLKIKTD